MLKDNPKLAKRTKEIKKLIKIMRVFKTVCKKNGIEDVR